MRLDTLDFFIPLFSFILSILVQITSFHLFRNMKVTIIKSIFIGYFVGIGTDFFLIQKILLESPHSTLEGFFYFLSHFTFYSCLNYCYFHYVNVGECSLRVRILAEINKSSEGLLVDELFSSYNDNKIFDKRMEKLLSSGHIVLKDGHYYLGKKDFLIIAKFFLNLRRIYFGSEKKVS